MLRVLSSFLLLLLIAAPSARADGFREREVRDALTAAGFGKIASQVAGAARPVVTVDLAQRKREPAALGTSRFGGRPDLPTSAAWPMCKGKHQTFLAQIRVRELPGAARELRRLGGTLLFFTHVEFEEGERDYGLYGGECTTVLHARAGTALRRTATTGRHAADAPLTAALHGAARRPGLRARRGHAHGPAARGEGRRLGTLVRDP